MEILSFIGGINQSVDESLISPNEAVNSMNCVIDDGVLRHSASSTPYSSAIPTNIVTLMKYFSGSEETLLASSNGRIYKYLTATNVWSEVASGFTNNVFDFVNAQFMSTEIVVIGNGVDKTQVYNGIFFRDLKHDGRDTPDTDENKAPKGCYIEFHKERLWIAGDSTAPNMVYFSTAFEIDDWTAPITEGQANQHGGFIDIPTWDGGKIIGIKALFDDMIVFKNKTIHRIYGTNPSNFSVSNVFNAQDGVIVEKSICSVGNKVFWLTDKGIFSFDGREPLLLSDKINTIFKNLNKNYINNAVATIYDNKYLIAVPDSNSTSNNLLIEYNILTGAFMVYTMATSISNFVEFQGKLRFSKDQYIYTYKDGSSPLTGAYWQTGTSDGGEINATKNVEGLYFIASGNGVLRFTITTEKKSVTKDITLSITEKPYRVRMRNKGRKYSLRIESVGNTAFCLKHPTIVIEKDYD